MLESLGGTRFEIIDQLGAGGMGVVYAAVDRETGERVALKTLHHLTAQSLYRFKNEFRALRGLYHPNLVRLGELHGEGDRWFFTMELIVGQNVLLDLRPRRAPRPSVRPDAPATHADTDVDADDATPGSGTAADLLAMPAARVPNADLPTEIGLRASPANAPVRAPDDAEEKEVDWERLRGHLLQIAEALIVLHEAGKVHRDLKPSNVMVTEAGRVVLLDFGLVLEAHGDEGESTDENVAGTIAYMAPEQASPGPTGPAADWYALGVMLYQLLSGRLPFQGPPSEVIANKRVGPDSPPRASVGRAPAELCQLALDLLQPEPDARPSGDEVRRRLGRKSRGSSRPPKGAALADQVITGPLALLGRVDELELLAGAFERARARRLASVVITGETGIGKTTLALYFIDELRRERPDAIVLRSRCRRDELVPFQAIDGLVDSLSHALMRLPEARVARLLPPRLRLLVDVFPVLRRVPAIDALSREALDLPPNERRASAFAALQKLLAEVASEWPVIVFIDDLNFIDRDSATELDAMFASESAPALLLLATSRPFEEPDDQAFPAHGLPAATRRIELAPLSATAARALVEQLHPSIDVHSVPNLVAAAAGHPQLLQELVRHARSHPERGAVTLEEALLARIEALDASARTVLEVTALTGGPCPESALARTLERDLGSVRAVLGVLEAGRLVRVERAGAKVTVEPENERVAGVVTARMGAQAADALRTRLLEALEAEPERGAHEDVAVRLLEALGRHEEAARHLLAAADAAETRLAFDRVAELLLVALRLGAFGREQERTIAERAARCLSWAGNFAEAGRQLERAAQLAVDPVDRAEILARAAEAHATGYDAVGMERAATLAYSALGRRYPAAKWLQLASLTWALLAILISPLLAFVRADDAPQARERRLWHSLSMSIQIGSYVVTDLVLGAFATFAAIYQGLRLGDSVERIRGLWMEAIILASAGLERAARRRIATMKKLAARMDDRRAMGASHFGSTIVLTKLGDFEGAEEEAERGLEYGPWMDAFEYVGMTSRVGLVLGMTGHVERGLVWTRRGLARVRANVRNDMLELCRDTVVLKLAILGRPNDGEARFAKLLTAEDWSHGRVQFGIGMGLGYCYETEHEGPLVHALLRAHQTSAVSASHPADEGVIQYVFAPYLHARRALAGAERAERDLAQSLPNLRKVTGWRMLAPHRPILEAALELLRGHPERALRKLDEAETMARQTNNPWATFESIAMRVRCFIRMGYERDARLHLRMALALAEEQRWARRSQRLTSELGRLLDRD